MRKIAVMVASDKKPPTTVGVNLIPKLLGPPKVFTDKIIDVPTVGISTGLAWSQYGGSVLFVESMRTPGKGNIKVTGNAGKVLQESADAAFTWIRSHSKEYGVDLAKINEYDIHVHLPAGATPKDGPSAGIAMTASLLSTILNVPVRNDVAMTGEISLRGRVLPIGGLKEKVLAAHRAGIKTIIFPKDNLHDTDDIPADVLSELQMVPVTDIKEALKILLSVEPVEVTEIKTSSLSEEPIFSKGN
jgi:ATP-dependent Lon protease